MVAKLLAIYGLSFYIVMVRIPPKLRGTSNEAVWINQLREVVISLVPLFSVNNKLHRTTKGTIMQGAKGSGVVGADSSKAVWL